MSLILTKAGLNAYAQSETNGVKLQATHMAVGDGGGAPVAHTDQSEALVNETWRGGLQGIEVAASGEVEFTGHVPITVGGWYIREVAIYADDTLLALGSHPETWKPAPESPDKVELVITAPVKFANADVVDLTIDPTAVLASQEYVADVVGVHASRTDNPHQVTPALIGARTMLTQNLTLYVSPTGDDDNDGLREDSPLATIQAAYDLLADHYDLAGYTATILLADGTYTAGVTIRAPVPGSAIGSVTITGNAADTMAVEINATSCVGVQAPGCSLTIANLKLNGTWGVVASNYGLVVLGRGVTFGAVTNAHITASYGGAVLISEDYAIMASAAYHALVKHGYIYNNAVMITLTDTPGFTYMYWVTEGGEAHISNVDFDGEATGKRYRVEANGVLYTGGGGSTFIPGDTAGMSTTGGQYV